MRAVFLAAGLLAVMGLVTGCASKCESVCSEANACTVSQRAVDVDCPEYCADVDDFNARAKRAGQESCDASFQKHLSCWEANSAKICDKEFEGCDEAREEFVACMTAYCAAIEEAEETDPNCTVPDPEDPDERSEPTLAPF